VKSRRTLLDLLFCLLASGTLLGSAEPNGTAASTPVLNRVRTVKALSWEQADRHWPVHLNGVVTYYDASWNLLMVADRTGGVLVQPKEHNLQIGAGDGVVVDGVSGAGGFAPVVEEARITSAGVGDLPTPKPLSELDATSGRLDNEWVKIQGYVVAVKDNDEHTEFRLATQFGLLDATMPQAWNEDTIRQYLDAKVEVRAVCGSTSNEKRQFKAVHLWLPSLKFLDVEDPPVADPFVLPTRPVASLLQYQAQAERGPRVRVKGVVTVREGANSFFLQDASNGARVRTRYAAAVEVGDEIEAVGYPVIDGYSPGLQETLVRRVSSSPLPVPVRAGVDQLQAGKKDCLLVQINARLLKAEIRRSRAILSLEADQKYFQAMLPLPGGGEVWPVGSELELTGVCDVKVDERKDPATFVLLLRGPESVKVLNAPSWWTPERASIGLGTTSAILLAAMTWVSMLRRRVARQTCQIRAALEQEAALERRYGNLVENAQDFIFTCDATGRFTSFNAAGVKLTGYAKQEALTKTLFDLTAPDSHESLQHRLRAELKDEAIRRQEVQLVTRSGERRTVELTLTFLSGESGLREGHGIARDVTARKQMELELRKARDLALESARQKAEFLANMSHEIRTPMNGVIGMTNLLLDTSLDRQQQDFAETIRNSADALLTVVNDILDFSKIEAGKLTFECLDFDLQDTVEAALDLLAPRADAKGLELGCSLDSGTPTALRGDAMRLRQILTNLVGNALKFTEQGEVMVRVKMLEQNSERATLRFEVADTGIGISKEAQERLFQPFSQADGSTTRRFGGTGLGLAISKQLVELMRGQIGVDSEPGRGSTFWFTVILEKQVDPAPAVARTAAHLANLRVLIVDDNQSNRRILDHQISSWRMQCGTCASGEEAMAALRQKALTGEPYDLAILDMQMPRMDGLTLAREIKADPVLAPTRLVMLSSLGQPLSEVEMASLEISASLLKPVKQSRLFDCLATVIGSAITDSAPVQKERSSSPASRALRILLVEDNPINQKVALGQLQRLGFAAEVANNGRLALQALERAPYDVVLMDCQMPELDGYETTHLIREQEQKTKHTGRRAHIYIIAMTAHAMKGDREKCLAAGMDDYISKPIRTEELGAALEKGAATLQTSSSDTGEPTTLPPEGVTPGPVAPQRPVSPTGAGPEYPTPINMEQLLEAVGGIEEEARSLSEFYMEQAREMLGRLEEAIRGSSMKDIEHVAHKLAGASASCGVIILLGPLRELEHTARSGELTPDKAGHLFQDVQDRYRLVEHFLASCFPAVQNA
jgi:two-component system sensor histidine kinase/response regulator